MSERNYWRSLEELADSPDFEQWLQREFPRQAAVWDRGLSRRRFLKLMAASLALGGLAACTPPARERVVPYVNAPDGLVPGRPLFFATGFPLGGYLTGLLVESREGRPIKVEGNPDHPGSLGATDVFAQAAVLGLYDPDRSQSVLSGGRARPWDEFVREVRAALDQQRAGGGAGLRVLTETVSSPALADQLTRWLAQFPQARWHQYQPVNRDNARAGALLAFGEDVDAVYRIENADVIVSLDADFLSVGPGRVRYTREFARRRQVREAGLVPNRLYAAESTLTLTGANADHRLPLRSSQIEPFARMLAAAAGVDTPAGPRLDEVPQAWLSGLAEDLLDHRGACLVIPGEGQPPAVHALAHALNDALDNVGRTVIYVEPVEANPVDQSASLRELVGDMNAGQVEALLILGGNPVYTAPADIDFAGPMSRVPFSLHLSPYHDETSARCGWHVPAAHFLEQWGDGRAFDGTASILQPLIAPLYGGLSPHGLLALLDEAVPIESLAAGDLQAIEHEVVRAYWQAQASAPDFEAFWRRAVHDGIVPDSARPERSVTLRPEWAGDLPAPNAPPGALEVVFRPDPTVYDGSLANNAWLQELPKPLTKLAWDNAALISPDTASRLGLADEDVIELRLGDRAVEAPALIMPGHAPESVTLHLGYGRTRAGHAGDGAGFDAYRLRTSTAPGFASGVELRKTGHRLRLATTQDHFALEGRDLVRAGTLAEYRAHPDFARAGQPDPEHAASLYPEPGPSEHRWGMAIDMSACVGCQACVIACQAENNIPVVGKEQVMAGREMHWLRVDHYYSGEPADPEVFFQPVPCMQCEQAPCEVVCPVAATVHSQDGLNEMIYNRCVGTRYCSNNCPYKVRRFNFLDYGRADEAPILKMLHNPEVTVRSTGVMEKCTYCVQRIRRAQIDAQQAGRPVGDGEVVTACQAVCPADAIVFGDMNDPHSRVTAMKAQPLNYALLAELNTRPRTTYLAAVRNPNPRIVDG